MFYKHTLTDQSIFLKEIPEKLLNIDFDKLKKDSLISLQNKQKINSNEESPFKNYYRLENNKYVQWIYELVRDFYRLQDQEHQTLILRKSYFININKNCDLEVHNHIDEYDLQNSPDFSLIVSLVENKNDFVEFQYEYGRKRHMKQRVPLNKGEIILFNSELKHRFITSRTHENLSLLSFQMQLIS